MGNFDAHQLMLAAKVAKILKGEDKIAAKNKEGKKKGLDGPDIKAEFGLRGLK